MKCFIDLIALLCVRFEGSTSVFPVKKLLIMGILFGFVLISIPGTAGSTAENERLIILDATGSMPPQRFETLVRKVDSTLTEVIKFWSTDPRIKEFGKIIVEFHNPLPKASSSIFMWRKENGKKARVVRVYGGGEYPLQLAHKLTSALFPNPDKLIRNMMGEASERRFGNPLSFPSCGFDKDEWVLALVEAGSYIPLTKIGPNHRDWGMEIVNHAPVVNDRAKQHASYVEAGSFGEFLITTHGIDKMKAFNRLSRKEPRPWLAAFGSQLEQLEAGWLEALRSKAGEKKKKISILVKLLRNNPKAACNSAQDFVKEETR
jgi:hypothetical protein